MEERKLIRQVELNGSEGKISRRQKEKTDCLKAQTFPTQDLTFHSDSGLLHFLQRPAGGAAAAQHQLLHTFPACLATVADEISASAAMSPLHDLTKSDRPQSCRHAVY